MKKKNLRGYQHRPLIAGGSPAIAYVTVTDSYYFLVKKLTSHGDLCTIVTKVGTRRYAFWARIVKGKKDFGGQCK